MRRDVLLYAQSVRVRGVLREVLTPRMRPLWVSPGYARYPHSAEDAMASMKREGWSFVRRRDHDLIFRRLQS